MTPASYLKILVEAYHHGGQAAVPFYIDTKRWFHLNIDEYITYSALYNSFGKVEWEKMFHTVSPIENYKKLY